MTDSTREIIQLREKRLTPKQIARKLGMKVSEVNAIIRSAAETETQALIASGEPLPFHKCFVDQGTAADLLGMEPSVQEDEAMLDDEFDEIGPMSAGLAQVIVSRHLPRHKLNVATFLVDCWCLGVKDAIPPRQISENQLAGFLNTVGRHTQTEFVEISPEQAQSLVWGGIDYAKSLGFNPHPDFEKAKEVLGDRPETLPMTLEFGKDGQPFYSAGPYDDVPGILKTLRKNVGKGNFHYIVPAM